MKNRVIMLMFVLIFSGCVSSSLRMEKSGDVSVYNENESYLLGDKIQDDKLLFFSDIEIAQSRILSTSGEILFREDAHTHIDYEFSETELATVMYVFDESQKSHTVYYQNNLHLAQVQLKNLSFINVLIQADDTQEYTYIYGFSNEVFVKIAQAIKMKNTEISMPKYKVVVFDEDSKPQTNWNNYIIYYTPLVQLMNVKGNE